MLANLCYFSPQKLHCSVQDVWKDSLSSEKNSPEKKKKVEKKSALQMFPLPFNSSEAEQEKQARCPIFNPEPCSSEYGLSRYVSSLWRESTRPTHQFNTSSLLEAVDT